MPNTIDVTEGQNDYSFTIAATGILTLHVTEDGTENGTPIVGAIFNRTDSQGTIYGQQIITDTNGNAIFNNVPFADSNAPTIYYKQISSDSTHEFADTVASTSLVTNTRTIEVINTPAASRTITLVDQNYGGIPIEEAQLTITSN